ncbi:MAG: response regulator [Candidatus Omnitrophica bacterium]|nr:response regulator [Candidatus Omnitrophota bacterium]
MDKKKILIVDDEADVLSVLEKRLSSAGYEVLTVDNGADAVLLAKSRKPDLILLDIMMPVMDGPAVCSALKNDIATKNIPVVFLTCLITRSDEMAEGHRIGGNFFIAKPYDPEELLKEIGNIVGKK